MFDRCCSIWSTGTFEFFGNAYVILMIMPPTTVVSIERWWGNRRIGLEVFRHTRRTRSTVRTEALTVPVIEMHVGPHDLTITFPATMPASRVHSWAFHFGELRRLNAMSFELQLRAASARFAACLSCQSAKCASAAPNRLKLFVLADGNAGLEVLSALPFLHAPNEPVRLFEITPTQLEYVKSIEREIQDSTGSTAPLRLSLKLALE